jgi:DNA-binding response OmpR family regulator
MTIHDPVPIVLLISNDPAFIYLIERYGQQSACQVITMQTIDLACQLIESAQSTLVVLYAMSPDPGGWDAVRVLKAETAKNSVPFVVCGTVTDEADVWETGADYFLSKPVMYDDFRAALNKTTKIIRNSR